VKHPKKITPMDGTAVRCEAECCEKPALFLFAAGGTSGARWAYCEEHAALRARQEKLQPPTTPAMTAAAI
jgi:hypothetical protein